MADEEKKMSGLEKARAALKAKREAMTPEERKAATAKANEAKKKKYEAKKAAAAITEPEAAEPMPEPMTNAPKETDIESTFSSERPKEPATVESSICQADENEDEEEEADDEDEGGGGGDLFSRYKPSKKPVAKPPIKERARSNKTAAAEAANPEEVAELRAAVGKFYGVEAVAAALDTTTRTVLTYIKSGRLKAVKVAAIWKISAENLRRFMDGE